MTSEKEGSGKAVQHIHRVELVVVTHRAEAEVAPYILCVFEVLVADVGVSQLRVDRLLGSELLLVHLLRTIH